MDTAIKQRLRRAALPVALLVAGALIAVGGFLVDRGDTGSGSPASTPEMPLPSPETPAPSVETATPLPTPTSTETIDTSRPGWAIAVRDADRQLPRYDQVINGIPVGPTASRTVSNYCSTAEPRWVEWDEARDIDPSMTLSISALPQGGVLAHQKAIACGDVVVSIETAIEIPAGPDAGSGKSWFDVAHGGRMDVYKSRAAAPGWRSQIAAERWEAIEVRGLPAALGHAILREEFGESAVVVWDADAGIQVTVRGFEVELADLLTVAEDVLR